MKTGRKALVRRLDKAFKEKAQHRDTPIFGGKCPWCPRPSNQPFHFITRSKHSVRWDLRNVVMSCGGCNVKYEHDQTFVDLVLTWYKKRFGQDAWDQLVRDSHVVANFSMTRLREIEAAMKADLATAVPGERGVFGRKA